MKKIIFPIALVTAGLVGLNTFEAAAQTSGSTQKKNINIHAKTLSKTQMKGFKTDIQKDAIENNSFRKVLYTAKHLQLVLMSLKPGEEIGLETHANSDQFFRFEGGKGKCIINETVYTVKDGDVIIVPAGSKHNVINTDTKKDLKLYTIYAEPQHKDGIIRATKNDAERHEAKFDGKTTEKDM
ncbi:mannose-6-phosphate isomerase-like protein (cupin superfamily) [Pedobacter cryoconitis]|uniref:Mannose-6-phosphate isomerase-like protein (Cupin superfamily) n=1 Tax=Pedobacter cryoconitis TaxID=188932 RepID=A0A7W8ZQN9_9SPHI|nr:cupin domain-containing protein [Pedobacter cryoconitis]MBB5638396.1 mannose-6-phosphate isomerase-like protein (cupin superfamily) [Pedobacter cryoconitis]